MSDLNAECDYSTDSDQICKDQHALIKDLHLAIQYYVIDEPLDLVDQIAPYKKWP
jgi:hypothetical protein